MTLSGEDNGAPKPLLLTIAQASETLNLGRTHIFALVKEGAIESVKIGRSRRIPYEALEEFAASNRALLYAMGTPARDLQPKRAPKAYTPMAAAAALEELSSLDFPAWLANNADHVKTALMKVMLKSVDPLVKQAYEDALHRVELAPHRARCIECLEGTICEQGQDPRP